jgi:hypothetical protein
MAVASVKGSRSSGIGLRNRVTLNAAIRRPSLQAESPWRNIKDLCYINSNKPLAVLAERVGFEPTVPCGTPDFESGNICISPR